jgi:hypothetical protein
LLGWAAVLTYQSVCLYYPDLVNITFFWSALAKTARNLNIYHPVYSPVPFIFPWCREQITFSQSTPPFSICPVHNL